MKKIIIGAMLVALSTSIGVQDADAKLFGSRKTTAEGKRVVSESVENALVEAVDFNKQMKKKFEGIRKSLKADPNYKDLSSKSFDNDQNLLNDLIKIIRELNKAPGKLKLRSLQKKLDKINGKLYSVKDVNDLKEQYYEDGVSEEKPTEGFDKFKAKLSDIVKKGQQYDKNRNSKQAKESALKMDTLMEELSKILPEYNVYDTSLNELENLNKKISELISAIKHLQEAQRRVDNYDNADLKNINDNLAELERLTARYVAILKEINTSISVTNKDELLAEVTKQLSKTLEKVKKSLNNATSDESSEEVEEDSDDTEEDEETTAKSTSRSKKESFGSRVKSFFGKSKSGSKSKTVRESKSRAIKAI